MIPSLRTGEKMKQFGGLKKTRRIQEPVQFIGDE